MATLQNFNATKPQFKALRSEEKQNPITFHAMTVIVMLLFALFFSSKVQTQRGVVTSLTVKKNNA